MKLARETFARFLLSVLVLRLLALVDFDSGASRFAFASFLASGRCTGHGSSNNVPLIEQ